MHRSFAPVLFAFCGAILACSLCSAADLMIADAAEAENWTLVETSLRDVDPDDAQSDGMTALHWAVYHGHIATVEKLVAAKCAVDAKTRYEVTPLSIACTLGHDKIVKTLLNAGADANREQPGGVTPLMLAARNGNAKSIQHLLAKDAKVNEGERHKQTPLMWAAAEGNVSSIDALIDGGADLSKTSKLGFTAMMFAVREGHIDVVNRLLEAGVDVNAVMKPSSSGARVPRKNTSALIMAVESGHFAMAMFLVKKGADPNDQRCGISALHLIPGIRKPNRGEGTDGDPAPRGSGNMSSLEFVRAIVAAGAEVDLKLKTGASKKASLCRKGATPMLLAGKTADIDLMKLLVELGGDPLEPNSEGCTPLMACAGIGVRAVGEEAGTEPEVIAALEYLISQGADVNTVDDNKETAMHGAAYRCYPKVVQFLAANGADPKKWDHKNRSGWTPKRIGQGYRPGSFKPHPPTVAAIEAAKKKPASVKSD